LTATERAGWKGYRWLWAKLLLVIFSLLLSFSQERLSEKTTLAQRKFYSGTISLENRNYEDAIRDLTSAFNLDRRGYYGELAYLWLGRAYALLAYSKADRRSLFSALAFLNMYPYYFKRPNYGDLQKEFLGDIYLLLEDYPKAKELYLGLYKNTDQKRYLVKFLYADALEGGTKNIELLDSLGALEEGIDPSMLPLIKGYYLYNQGRFKEALSELMQARAQNRNLEEDPHFLYRLALSYYILEDWRNGLFYFELLRRRDVYRRYADKTNYFLLFINLDNKNYSEAMERLQELMKDRDPLTNLTLKLALSQLWFYEDFIYKYKLSWYKPLLLKIAWVDYAKSYGLPSLLGVYYYSLKDKKLMDGGLLKRAKVPRESYLTVGDIKINLERLYKSLEVQYKGLNPYEDKDFEAIEAIYKANEGNFLTLFDASALLRGSLYRGKLDYVGLLDVVGEPTKSFLRAQEFLLTEKEKEGVELLSKVKDQLTGEDHIEALFLLGFFSNNKKLLETAMQTKDLEKSQRLKGYIPNALLELGDYYYSVGNFTKAKEFYKGYLERSEEEDTLYWLTALRLARLSGLTKDEETLQWVVKRAKKTDNILGRLVINLWGE
jgi:outer membrane protein assembly factor BamD (BamD/ComL family)